MPLPCSTQKEIDIFIVFKVAFVLFFYLLQRKYFITFGRSQTIPIQRSNFPILNHQPALFARVVGKYVGKFIGKFGD
jgi:hypothetical protein